MGKDDKYPFETKSVEELVAEANAAVKNTKEMTEEEEILDDAEGGYFDNEED